MNTLLDRWRAHGVPSSLRWWIPSPFALSDHLSITAHSPVATALRVLFASLVAVSAANIFCKVETEALHIFARSVSPASWMLNPMVAVQHSGAFGAWLVGAMAFGFALLADVIAGPALRHVARVGLAAGALVALQWSLGAEFSAPLRCAIGVIAVALGVAVVSPGEPTSRLVERLTRGALASSVAAIVVSAGFVVATLLAHRDNVDAAALATSNALYVGAVWGCGVAALGCAAVMLKVFSVDRTVWSAPDTWIDATITADRTIRFANGMASRQAPASLVAPAGPVVIIPLGEVRKGVFRGDGAPDDGWTVPGTTATLRDAVIRAELAARATVIFVALFGLGALCSAISAAIRAL